MGVTEIVDDYDGFDGPRVLISERRHKILARTLVGCWTCDNTVAVGDAFDHGLGWGVIEVPLEDGTDTIAWECPSCASAEPEMRE